MKIQVKDAPVIDAKFKTVSCEDAFAEISTTRKLDAILRAGKLAEG